MHVHGSCHCGHIRYEAHVDPQRAAVCHCTDCQRLTGTAFRVSVPAQPGSFRLLAGEPAVYVKVGDSGSRRAQAFCRDCGSPLYTYDADHTTTYGLRVGCLDERQAIVPQRQKWFRSALGWTQEMAGLVRAEGE